MVCLFAVWSTSKLFEAVSIKSMAAHQKFGDTCVVQDSGRFANGKVTPGTQKAVSFSIGRRGFPARSLARVPWCAAWAPRSGLHRASGGSSHSASLGFTGLSLAQGVCLLLVACCRAHMRVVRKVLAFSYEGEDLLVLALTFAKVPRRGSRKLFFFRESFLWLADRKLE